MSTGGRCSPIRRRRRRALNLALGPRAARRRPIAVQPGAKRLPPRLDPRLDGVQPQRGGAKPPAVRGDGQDAPDALDVVPRAQRVDVDEVVFPRAPDVVRDEKEEAERVEETRVGHVGEVAEGLWVR